MAAISYKCPNCGGDLRFDPKSRKFKCEYCISTFSQEELEDTATAGAAPTGEEEESDAVEYSCPSCGAQIIADTTTAATFCYYCHNPVVFQGKVSGKYRPDLIIPFEVDKKEAVESFLKYVRGKKLVPARFFCKEQIEKISGVYFPFWVYSCKADGDWHGQGSRINITRVGDIEYTETKVFDVEREAELEFENITRDALNRENKQLVEAVQPFDLRAAKEFSMGYLSGFQAEKRDIEREMLAKEIKQEVRAHSKDMMQAGISGYQSVTPREHQVSVRQEDWKYLLLPVWVLTYRGKDGKMYYYAMNGQSKKVSGVLPVSLKRLAGVFLGIFFVLCILLLLGGYFLW